jgi:hypothetical protein
MSEVRPWIGSIGTLATFSTLKDLKVIDCSKDATGTLKQDAKRYSNQKASPDELERGIWQDINAAFSRPVESTEKTAEYVPTQVLAEAFRSAGFDGLMYQSSLGPGLGKNIALFDPALADVIDRRVFFCAGVHYDFGVLERCHNGSG